MSIDTLINLGVAVGTILVAIAAIWGDRLTSWLNPARARIELHDIKGTKEIDAGWGGQIVRYHLKVANKTRWKILYNCRVLLAEVYRKDSSGTFQRDPFPVPRQFIWAPADLSPIAVTVSKKVRIFDFGALSLSEAKFRPCLYPQGGELHAEVERDEAVRYRLEVVADNLQRHQSQLFEVAFDGTCSDDLDELSRHLVIREIGYGES
jgi:hypothetical protein